MNSMNQQILHQNLSLSKQWTPTSNIATHQLLENFTCVFPIEASPTISTKFPVIRPPFNAESKLFKELSVKKSHVEIPVLNEAAFMRKSFQIAVPFLGMGTIELAFLSKISSSS
jgi:hypothetical protein